MGGSSTMSSNYHDAQYYDGNGTLGRSKMISGHGTMGGHGKILI